MFHLKRNFSLLESPKKSTASGSPTPSVHRTNTASPIKRLRLSSFLSSTLLQESRKNGLENKITPQNNNASNPVELYNGNVQDISMKPPAPEPRLGLSRVLNANFDSKVITRAASVEPIDCMDDVSLHSCASTAEKAESQTLTPGSSKEKSFELPPEMEPLDQRKAALQKESDELDVIIEERMNEIKRIRKQTIELQAKRYMVKDYMDIATRSQNEVRNLLNDMFNPGQELAKRAKIFIDESRRGHKKKFEKLEFELNDFLDTKITEVGNGIKQVTHEIELHERTLLTLECQKRHQDGQVDRESQHSQSDKKEEPANEEEPMIKSEKDLQYSDVLMNITEKDVSNMIEKDGLTDDDCVIIDDNDQSSEFGEGQELSGRVSEQRGTTGKNQSETTATCDMDEDEEETDIDEPREVEEERSFTPCQAQRPM